MNRDRVAGMLAILALSLLTACQRDRSGHQVTCPLSDAGYRQQIAAAGDWDALYTLYRTDSPRCPAASAQASYSRQLVLLFVRQWQEVPALAQGAQRDPALAAFIYGHIDKNADAASLRQLLENAGTRCPAGASAFCDQVAWRAQAALIAQGLSS
jgi:hypothetical protein